MPPTRDDSNPKWHLATFVLSLPYHVALRALLKIRDGRQWQSRDLQTGTAFVHPLLTGWGAQCWVIYGQKTGLWKMRYSICVCEGWKILVLDYVYTSLLLYYKPHFFSIKLFMSQKFSDCFRWVHFSDVLRKREIFWCYALVIGTRLQSKSGNGRIFCAEVHMKLSPALQNG